MLPVITIARQYGSGGHEVGEKLAKKLGIPYYDKALIAMAAKKSGLSEEVFADVDEKATSSLLYNLSMGGVYAQGGFSPDEVRDAAGELAELEGNAAVVAERVSEITYQTE